MQRESAVVSGVISYDESVALIEESEVKTQVDLGASMLYRLIHPVFGDIVVINSSVGKSGCMQI